MSGVPVNGIWGSNKVIKVQNLININTSPKKSYAKVKNLMKFNSITK